MFTLFDDIDGLTYPGRGFDCGEFVSGQLSLENKVLDHSAVDGS
jgi:hypothetical protein